MDDSEVLLAVRTIAHILRLHYPLPCLVMNRLTDWYKLVHQGTWVVQPLMDKREEKVNSTNTHAHKSLMLRIGGDEDGVATRVLVPLQRHRTNIFVMHAACSTEVTHRTLQWRNGKRRYDH